jgi:hypothetical protein
MFGWLRELISEEEQISLGWSGAISLPRYIFFINRWRPHQFTGNSFAKSCEELMKKLSKPNQISEQVRGACLEILIRVPPDIEKWSGVHLMDGMENGILIGYDAINGVVVLDCRHAGGLISAIPVDPPGMQDLLLHVFLDGSVIETYIDDRTPISARFYVPKPQTLRVRLVGKAIVDLWEIKI